DFTARGDLWQHDLGDAVDPEHFLVPGKGCEIHELRATGVGHVGHVDAALRTPGELPDEKAVDISKEQISGLGRFQRAWNVFKNPTNLKTAEISRKRQTGLFSKAILAAVAGELRHHIAHAGVLPDERVV